MSTRAPALASDPSCLADRMAADASSALRAIVGAGAQILVFEPWRATRIVRGAERMTLAELRAHLAARRGAPPAADLNQTIALAQLSLAAQRPDFAAAWAGWRRAREEGEAE